MIRTFDHTADVGFEVSKAATPGALFDEARQALLATMFERPPENREEVEPVRLSGPDLETLLVRWLNELVFLVQDLGFVPTGAEVRIEDVGNGGYNLEARLAGTPLDTAEHGWRGEIKSATFHGLRVTRESAGWRARVILDV